MFGKHVFTEAEYIQYVKQDRSHRQLLTWTGVVTVPAEDIENFLEELYLYEKNPPLVVVKNLERKEKQNQAAKRRCHSFEER
jgi:hypothetical protein